MEGLQHESRYTVGLVTRRTEVADPNGTQTNVGGEESEEGGGTASESEPGQN